MEEQLITYLDECLAAIEAGDTMERCLARYPNHADELAPLLQIATALERLPQLGPSPATAATAKSRFLAEADRRWPKTRQSLWSHLRERFSVPQWSAPLRAAATAMAAIALVILVGGGVVFAASGSLPGDPLYGFKLFGEDIQMTLALNRDSRLHLEETFTERRRDEVRQLLAKGRQETVAFVGLLRERSNGDWLIEDIPVIINSDTRLQADPALDAFIEIHGTTLSSGSVLATLVEIEGDEIVGRVERISESHWQVAGWTVQVDGQTYVEAGLRVGDCVEVHARRFNDGTLLALGIERSSVCDEPSATQAPSPTPTPTPMPTHTSTPSPTPAPSATPSPTPSPSPTITASPTPTATPSPVATVTPSPTPELDNDDTPTPTLDAPDDPTSEPDPDDNDNDDGGDDNDDDDGGDGDNENDSDEDDGGDDDDNGNDNEDNENDGGDDDDDGDDGDDDDGDNSNDNEDEDDDSNSNDDEDENDNG